MRDYLQEMIDAWANEGPQAAYEIGEQLLMAMEEEGCRLLQHRSAILSLGVVLRDRPDVDTTAKGGVAESPLETIAATARSRTIIRAAEEIWSVRQGNGWTQIDPRLITTFEVREKLIAQGVDLGVQQPLAVIGTVLSSAEGFTKVARSTFEFSQKAPEPDADAEDLPW